jgi:CRISPR-associated endonuclease Csn1
MNTFRYRLAIDLGTNSLGWAVLRLNQEDSPIEITRTGVRIFGYNKFGAGRESEKGASLAVTRRTERAARRRRDRLLRRKAKMMHCLVEYGFFPKETELRKLYELLDPYQLRAEGLDRTLAPAEFARAIFQLNQRRGFQSNRRADTKLNDKSIMNAAITQLSSEIKQKGCRTAGELLWKRKQERHSVRARYTEERVQSPEGKTTKILKSYPLYVNRDMVKHEFESLWQFQSAFHPDIYTQKAYDALKNTLFHQRPLKPSVPGRCSLIPELSRAPLALPSSQNFRIHQDLNHLRILRDNLVPEPLTQEQKNILLRELQGTSRLKFSTIKSKLKLKSTDKFNLEDMKKQAIKGNDTSSQLCKAEYFGTSWFSYSLEKQDLVVIKLLQEQDEQALIAWLLENCDLTAEQAEHISEAKLADGYGSLSREALARILPELEKEVIPYSEAVIRAGFPHHSQINFSDTGEILEKLPYYAQVLQRHVGFGSGKPEDSDEKRLGKIANPTVHIGLNQFRLVVNGLIKRYGKPQQIVIEVARELRQSREQRERIQAEQAENQTRNQRLREQAAPVLGCSPEQVKQRDLEKMILWHELSGDIMAKACPYSGEQIGIHRLLLGDTEIEHILPIRRTLDDSLNNKTVCIREANRLKGNQTPWEARDSFEARGWPYADIVIRAKDMRATKRYRFAEGGLERWQKGGINGEGKDFLARALNDTSYLSRLAYEYASAVCRKSQVWVIPGKLTGLLRRKLGLNHVLGLKGEKNREDHRHHAVDACVIGITDKSLLNAVSVESGKNDFNGYKSEIIVKNILWLNFRDEVQTSTDRIIVSHKPDHGHEGAMHKETAYGLLPNDRVRFHRREGMKRILVEENLKVIPISDAKALQRHGIDSLGQPKPYKGYSGNSNYCIEISRDDSGKWVGEVISTFEAHQHERILRKEFHKKYPYQSCPPLVKLMPKHLSMSGKALVMRLIKNDTVRLEVEDLNCTMRVASISGNGQIFFAPVHEANVDARNRDKADPFAYISKYAGSLQKARGRKATISPIGELRDPGFKE